MDTITLENGKYTLIRDTDGSLRALRYGEPWKDLLGDNLIGALMDRIEELQREPKEYKASVGEAGEAYLKKVAYRGEYKLPALFRWHELWDVMRGACMESETPKSNSID